jgi:hypothetical protein
MEGRDATLNAGLAAPALAYFSPFRPMDPARARGCLAFARATSSC